MEQESPKMETEEMEFQTLNGPILCANNCGFFGSSATDNLCSRCYEDQFRAKLKTLVSIDALDFPQIEDKSKARGVDGRGVESKPVREQAASASSAEAPCSNKPKNRCCFCNKKLGLLGFKCRCGDVFCSVHRYVDEHNCGFDYRGAGQAAIAKANPVVKADKIDKI